jgi:hypothetical protein
MSHLVIDNKNELHEAGTVRLSQPLFIRIAARVVSYVFHPLFIPVYLSIFILKTQSFLFSSLNELGKKMFVPRFFVAYTFLPLVSVLLLRALKFISSIQLKRRKDRIIPYVICMIYYWWSWYAFHNQPEFTNFSTQLSFAIFLACVGGFMANIYLKVSMHAIAAGVMLAFVAALGFWGNDNSSIYISIALFLTGIICTARFIESDHTVKEIYGGLLIGVFSMIAANYFA